MELLDTEVLSKIIFEDNEPFLNACSLPVVDKKIISSAFFMFTLYQVVKTGRKCRKINGELKNRGVCFPENDNVLLLQVTIKREVLQVTSSVQWFWATHLVFNIKNFEYDLLF